MSLTAHMHGGPRATKNATPRSPTPYLSQPESLILPDDPVGGEQISATNPGAVYPAPRLHGDPIYLPDYR